MAPALLSPRRSRPRWPPACDAPTGLGSPATLPHCLRQRRLPRSKSLDLRPWPPPSPFRAHLPTTADAPPATRQAKATPPPPRCSPPFARGSVVALLFSSVALGRYAGTVLPRLPTIEIKIEGCVLTPAASSNFATFRHVRCLRPPCLCSLRSRQERGLVGHLLQTSEPLGQLKKRLVEYGTLEGETPGDVRTVGGRRLVTPEVMEWERARGFERPDGATS